MRSDPALVSCIMPTRNRRHLAAQAVAYFLRQDYPRSELIVVDDGDDCIADLVAGDPRLRYIRLEHRTPLGVKRNLACHAARGELIAHWDDDDWMASNRLSLQVAALEAVGAVATGARYVLYYRVREGDAWLYTSPEDSRPWPVGGTLVYRRSAWEAQPFDGLEVGEDTSFAARLPAHLVHTTDDSSFYVGLLHTSNTAPKNLADPAAWRVRPLDEVARLLGADRDFYASLRNGHTMRDTPARVAGVDVNLAAHFDVTTGYGSMAEYLAIGLLRAGARVRSLPLSLSLTHEGFSPELEDLLLNTRVLDAHDQSFDTSAPTVFFSWPTGDFDRYQTLPNLFVNTMWESSALPADWPEQLNRARALIVPTRFVERVCRASGVRVPIVVIPEGIDPAVYSLIERPIDRPLTTLIVGTDWDRKHLSEGIAAWKLAFAGDADAKLIVKTSYAHPRATVDDDRIVYVDRAERSRGIAHWYAKADVLLALGNEGFGLPLLEAMATGLPAIALDSEGQADVCADAGERVLGIEPASWEPADSDAFGRCGVRGVPGVEDVAECLRWVAAHRRAASDIGRSAAVWAARERNIWDKAPSVLDVLERCSQPPRPLRRPVRLWASMRRTRRGVAEYTAHLADALPPATAACVSAETPDIGSTRVLHVQHGYGLYDEAALARTCELARHVHVPVVVTEHMVRSVAPQFEPDADALVSTSQAGADILRLRWPNKRVEHIPHGCPTWFPRRKRRRGRVIGAFGVMGPHKGFSNLLKVLRREARTPGKHGQTLELLLFGTSQSDTADAVWAAATKDLPVRRETRCLLVEDIATRLAAEADVLVFWDEEVDFPTVSGAVRVGLASGVPVLTPPTRSFADVRDVTYQPSDLEQGVRTLLEDTQLRTRLVEAAAVYCHAHSWARIAERHVALWRSLEHS